MHVAWRVCSGSRGASRVARARSAHRVWRWHARRRVDKGGAEELEQVLYVDRRPHSLVTVPSKIRLLQDPLEVRIEKRAMCAATRTNDKDDTKGETAKFLLRVLDSLTAKLLLFLLVMFAVVVTVWEAVEFDITENA